MFKVRTRYSFQQALVVELKEQLERVAGQLAATYGSLTDSQSQRQAAEQQVSSVACCFALFCCRMVRYQRPAAFSLVLGAGGRLGPMQVRNGNNTPLLQT